MEIEEFVPRGEIDPLYVIRPYYIVPDGKLGQDGFAIIREILRSMSRVALARVTLTNIERIIALDPYDKGMIGMLLRFPYEVRDAAQYFDDIQDIKINNDILGLAKHIVDKRAGHFEPQKFEDYYQSALNKLMPEKQKDLPLATDRNAATGNVINLMDALKQSLAAERSNKLPPSATANAVKARR